MARSGILETKRLRLVPFSSEFLTERYVGWLNDPEVVRFSEQRFRTHDLDSCKAYMNSFGNTHHHFWAVVSKAPEEGHIGNISSFLDERNETCDISILVGEKRLWGNGYGVEGFRAVVDFFFRERNARKVTAGTMAVNTGMLKIMERVGMVPDGTRRRYFLWEGREVDLVHSALFRETWKERG